VALTYQSTGYLGANVVYDPAVIVAASESFNKANGALGPDLTWTRAVFTHGFPYQVNTNQCRLSANAAGEYEDIQVPTPTVDTPTVQFTVNVTAVTRTGTGSYVVDTGGIARFQTRDGGTNYRGYAFATGRNNVFVPAVDLWHLLIFRVNGIGDQQLIASSFAALATVTLPGTLTFNAAGPDMTATFTHAGSAPTLTASVTDNVYTDGSTVLGGSIVLNGSDTASIDSDVLSITGDDANVSPDTRGFLWVRNTDASPKTVAVTVPGFTKTISNPDVSVTVPAGEQRMIGPLAPELAMVSGGRPLVAINYSPNVTGVSAAAVRIS
jgi:hypothetical protein